MVRLFEYQGKELLRKQRIPVPIGGIASSPNNAKKIAENIGKPVVIKAQIWTTSRLKAGGIKFADTPDDVEEVTKKLLGKTIKDFPVEKVLVEEKLDIIKEYYSSVIVDDATKGPLVIFSTEGGTEIEKVARDSPEKIITTSVDYLRGLTEYDVRSAVQKLGLKGREALMVSNVIYRLYNVFKEYDARIAEINPLVLTRDGRIYAADARITIDDYAIFRHPELGVRVARERERPPTELDYIAWKVDENDHRGTFHFIQLRERPPRDKRNGYIGFHGVGGGGSLLTMDAINRQGMIIANYADNSGNPTAAKVYRCAKIILIQPGIEGYFCYEAGIASQELWHVARGIVRALREEKPLFPALIKLSGNKEKEALEILKKWTADLPTHVEVYGREMDPDSAAKRMRELLKLYRKEKQGLA